MDTPERSKIAGTPLSKFEDSPTFNFIDNLSPIQPVRSAHGAQVFQSLSFASISSVFSSPHINAQKESRFSIKHQYSDSPKPVITSDNLDESNLCPGISDAKNFVAAGENCNIVCSLNEATVDPPEECSSQPSNLQQPIQCETGSPNHKPASSYGVEIELRLENGQTPVEVAHIVHDGVEKRKLVFTTEVELLNEHQDTQDKEDVVVSDWDDLISENADDLLIFDSATESEGCQGPEEKFGDSDANSSIFPSKPIDAIDPCPQNAMQCPLKGTDKEEHETDHTPQILSGTFQSQVGLSNQTHESGQGSDSGFLEDRKVDSHQQRGMRRRCLTFEVATGFTKTSDNVQKHHTSLPLPSSRKFASDDRKFASDGQKSTTLKTGSASLSRVLPSIGLHLNTLATTPSGSTVTKETPAFGKRFINMPYSVCPFPPIIAGQTYPNKLVAVEKDQCATGSEVRDIEVTHDDAPELSDNVHGENLSQSSPKKKKRKSENGGESEACKRCNCKKSKCLKLYCECFAAGIYCVEPCSCQGCFNKPIHEETVLATRKQIESRNPLAFAPKVIRSSESVQEIGEETNKTPASARHKRGCNCKKSSCLKKYCECFQGGVGCSPSCRCEGCKNAFGRKDADDTEHTEEAMDDSEKQQDKLDEDQKYDIPQKEDPSPESIILTPSFEICRPFGKPPFLSSGKPPRSSTLSLGHPTSQMLRRCQFPFQHKILNHFKPLEEDDTPEILKADASPKSGVKSISPNGKRVSPPYGARGMSPTRKGGRKLILKSIPSFPSLNGDLSNEQSMNHSSSHCTSSTLSSGSMELNGLLDNEKKIVDRAGDVSSSM